MRTVLLCASVLLACAHAPVTVSGPIGTNAPVTMVATAPDGRWVVLCQAREDTNGDGVLRAGVSDSAPYDFGDAMKPYFIEGTGAGRPIDRWVASDTSGDEVAFVRAGHLILRDTRVRQDLDLTLLGATASWASFSSDGNRVLYAADAGWRTLVIHDLRDGSERRIAEPRGIAGAVLDPTENWVLEWFDEPPSFLSIGDSPAAQCYGLPKHRIEYVDEAPDEFRSLGTNLVVPSDREAWLVGKFVVQQRPSKEIIATDPVGHTTTWVPAACGAKVLFVGVNATLGVTCSSRDDRLLLVQPGRTTDLQLEVPFPGVSIASSGRGPPRLVVVHAITGRSIAPDGVPTAESRTVLLDLATRETKTLDGCLRRRRRSPARPSPLFFVRSWQPWVHRGPGACGGSRAPTERMARVGRRAGEPRYRRKAEDGAAEGRGVRNSLGRRAARRERSPHAVGLLSGPAPLGDAVTTAPSRRSSGRPRSS